MREKAARSLAAPFSGGWRASLINEVTRRKNGGRSSPLRRLLIFLGITKDPDQFVPMLLLEFSVI
jgi:hypothetical protein